MKINFKNLSTEFKGPLSKPPITNIFWQSGLATADKVHLAKFIEHTKTHSLRDSSYLKENVKK